MNATPTTDATLPPRTYAEAVAALAPYASHRKLAEDVRLRKQYDADGTPSGMAIEINDTPVILFREDGWVEYHVGPRHSQVLRNRLNRYTPAGTQFQSRDRVLHFVTADGRSVRVTEGMQYSPTTRRIRHRSTKLVGLGATRLASNPAPTETIDSLDMLTEWLSQFRSDSAR